MRLTIVSVGHKMPEWVATATHDYIKRMPADCSIEIKEIKPDLTPAKEAIKIVAAIPKGSRVIALDERGKDQTTQNLATQLANWRQEGFDITFTPKPQNPLMMNLSLK
jgi:23S rRNA (pseudouridine1915-N3)-methyltransferase